MKTQITTLLLFCTVISFDINAQVSKIDYNAYKLPQVKFRALRWYGDLGGDSRKSSFYDDKEASFNNDLTLHYRTFNYSTKKQGESSLLLNNNVKYDATEDLMKRSFRPYIAYYKSDRTFDKKNNYFEWNTYTALNGEFNEVDDEKERNFGSIILFSALSGHGRIEPISTVFMAKFIVDDLLKNRILLEKLAEEKLFAFADQIAVLQNKRVFDTRNFRKYVIKNLAEWMLGNTKIDNSKVIDLTTTISDNWLFADIAGRSTGKSISYGLEPEYKYSYSKQPFGGLSESNQLGLNGLITYRDFKQISQYIQRSFRVETSVNVKSSPIQKFDRRTYTPNIYFSYSLDYYPNSRTTIELRTSISTRSIMTRFKGVDFVGKDPYLLDPRISMNYVYFINYNFQLFGYLNISQSLSFNTTYNYINTNLVGNFGMSYIFY